MNFKQIEPSELIGIVTKIHLYPIKSCGGLGLESAKITRRGLETVSAQPVRDREYMIVEGPLQKGTGYHKFLTQRDRGLQKLAPITPLLQSDSLSISWEGQDRFRLPTGEDDLANQLKVRVHSSFTTGVDQGDQVAKMLTDYLEKPVRLVRASGSSFHRLASQNYLKNDNTLSYQDAYSINWLFSASVEALWELLGYHISYMNFRPNIVASGGSPNLEHVFFHLAFGEIRGVQPKPSTRCMITNVNQETGLFETQSFLPLKMIYQNFNWKDKTGRKQAIFAENFLPEVEGIIKKSDKVIALSRIEPPLDYGKFSYS